MKKIKKDLIVFYQAKKRLVWIGSGVLLTLIAALVIFLPQGNTPAEDMQYVQVIRGSITESIGEVGYVEAQPSAVIMWQSGGIVGKYDLKIGDQVKKGDVLMELELSSWSNESLQAQSDLLDAQVVYENLVTSDSDFQTALQTLATAEWSLRDKQEDRDAWNYGGSSFERIYAVRANYLTAVQQMWVLEEEYEALRKTLEEDDPMLIEAKEALQATDLERDSYLRALNQILGHSYDLDVETDFNEYDQAKAAVDEARAGYNRILDNSQEIAAAKANVQAFQNTVDMAKVIAPFDGTITEISTMPGELIESGVQSVQLDDLDNLVVNVDVSEIDISKVENGQHVVVTFDALPYKKYTGVVTAISAAGADTSGTVEFKVTVTIEDADASVKPGFTALVSIITSQAEDVLLIPNQALRTINNNNSVLLVGEDDNPMPVRVEVGARSEVFTEIISGEIAEGDQLIVITTSSASVFGSGPGAMGGLRQITGGGGGGGQPPDQQ
ncbi:MAG: efflux RND transporter periplasmic adaptor subunit [Pelolinea sp.]|nr:efflux RND transporter periplasmic adaptor subunit [Pelolinea sp.]